jgi:hypothetical protein
MASNPVLSSPKTRALCAAESLVYSRLEKYRTY